MVYLNWKAEMLKWFVGLKLTQKTQLPLIIVAKKLKPILYRFIKGTWKLWIGNK